MWNSCHVAPNITWGALMKSMRCWWHSCEIHVMLPPTSHEGNSCGWTRAQTSHELMLGATSHEFYMNEFYMKSMRCWSRALMNFMWCSSMAVKFMWCLIKGCEIHAMLMTFMWCCLKSPQFNHITVEAATATGKVQGVKLNLTAETLQNYRWGSNCSVTEKIHQLAPHLNQNLKPTPYMILEAAPAARQAHCTTLQHVVVCYSVW